MSKPFLSPTTSPNTYLLSRFEGASAFPPLALISTEEYRQLSRLAVNSDSWEELPEEFRNAIKQSEANRIVCNGVHAPESL